MFDEKVNGVSYIRENDNSVVSGGDASPWGSRKFAPVPVIQRIKTEGTGWRPASGRERRETLWGR